jgi:regulator of replication initiation timing
MFNTLKKWLFEPRVIQLELDLQRQGVDLHTLRHHAQGQAEEIKALGMTNVKLHNQIDELEILNKRQFKTMGELRHELDAAKQRNRDYMTENDHLLKNLEKAENLVIKVKGDAERKIKEKPELTRLKNSLKGLKIDCMKWKAGQRAWQKHENRMGIKQ